MTFEVSQASSRRGLYPRGKTVALCGFRHLLFIFLSNSFLPCMRPACHGDVCAVGSPSIRAGVGGMLING